MPNRGAERAEHSAASDEKGESRLGGRSDCGEAHREASPSLLPISSDRLRRIVVLWKNRWRKKETPVEAVSNVGVCGAVG
jgi:hypothetical protein